MIRGAITVVLVACNTLFWGLLVTVIGLVKLLAPTRESRRLLRVALTSLGDRWSGVNNAIFDAL